MSAAMENVIPFAPIDAYEEATPLPEKVCLENFRAYLPDHKYIYEPTDQMWPASSVNSQIPPIKVGVDEKGKDIKIPASTWLDQNRAVVQMTWTPNEPRIIRDKVINNGGWTEQPGVELYNQYRPPKRALGDPNDVVVWINHLQTIYPEEWQHIVCWLAHRIQYPGQKINHALVLGGPPGIGKDTLLDPVRHGVGPWNFNEVSPQQMTDKFNPFIKCVVLRVSETRDLGDFDRYSFYEHCKTYTAAPPEVLTCDEKHIRQHTVVNVMGVILTTNYKTNGIYLPADDRRHYVAWSPREKESMGLEYFTRIYDWYDHGGRENVIAFLASHDLSKFDAKLPPPKTQAFFEIVDSNRSPEDAELGDTLDKMKHPDALTIPQLVGNADDDFAKWLDDRKNRRVVPHRLEAAGYQPVRHPSADQGLWKVDRKRQTVYAKKTLTYNEQCIAAQKLAISFSTDW